MCLVSDSNDESMAYTTSVELLAKREHSAQELAFKLLKRGFSADVVESVLGRLGDENLQSDARYTEIYLRQRSSKGYGPQRIRAELRERGIDDAHISAEFRRAEGEGELDWYVLAVEVYRKKYGGRPIVDIKERAKRMRFLQYRGFDHEQIAAAMDDA